MQEWTYLLTSERGLWPHHESFLWRLDETEGPHRTRCDKVYLYTAFRSLFYITLTIGRNLNLKTRTIQVLEWMRWAKSSAMFVHQK